MELFLLIGFSHQQISVPAPRFIIKKECVTYDNWRFSRYLQWLWHRRRMRGRLIQLMQEKHKILARRNFNTLRCFRVSNWCNSQLPWLPYLLSLYFKKMIKRSKKFPSYQDKTFQQFIIIWLQKSRWKKKTK